VYGVGRRECENDRLHAGEGKRGGQERRMGRVSQEEKKVQARRPHPPTSLFFFSSVLTAWRSEKGQEEERVSLLPVFLHALP
jgi:hypothetical protein